MKNVFYLYSPISRYFRSKRIRQLYDLLNLKSSTRVLDVGGSWRFFWCYAAWLPQVTVMNLTEEAAGHGPMGHVIGDGRCMHFEDGTFDVVIRNSVIEHVGGWSEQKAFANEIRRVGKAYYVQTPNRRFFLEPHVLTPFFQFLPKRWQRALVQRCTVRGLLDRLTPSECDDLTYGIRLLDRDELERLFPDAELVAEHFCGAVKSWIAIRTDCASRVTLR
jgi:hypothetical protein